MMYLLKLSSSNFIIIITHNFCYSNHRISSSTSHVTQLFIHWVNNYNYHLISSTTSHISWLLSKGTCCRWPLPPMMLCKYVPSRKYPNFCSLKGFLPKIHPGIQKNLPGSAFFSVSPLTMTTHLPYEHAV